MAEESSAFSAKHWIGAGGFVGLVETGVRVGTLLEGLVLGLFVGSIGLAVTCFVGLSVAGLTVGCAVGLGDSRGLEPGLGDGVGAVEAFTAGAVEAFTKGFIVGAFEGLGVGLAFQEKWSGANTNQNENHTCYDKIRMNRNNSLLGTSLDWKRDSL